MFFCKHKIRKSASFFLFKEISFITVCFYQRSKLTTGGHFTATTTESFAIPFEYVTTSYCGKEKFKLHILRNVTKNFNVAQSIGYVVSEHHVVENGLPRFEKLKN